MRPADTYLRTRVRWPVQWKNLESYLQQDESVLYERGGLFHVMSPIIPPDKGLADLDWADDPDKFMVLDSVWLASVTDLATRTNEGIEQEAIARLSVLPPRSKDARITVKEGVEIRHGKQGMEFVRLSDGLGIGLNKKDEYVRLSDRRKRATDEEVEGYIDRRVSPEELAIRQNAINVRQARDAIGHIIEALRHLPTLRLDAELDEKRVNVDIGRQVDEAQQDWNEQPRDTDEDDALNAFEVLTDDDVKALGQKLYAVHIRRGSHAGRAQAYLHLREDLYLNDQQARGVLRAMNCYRNVDEFQSGKELKEARRQAGEREERDGTRCFFCDSETTI